jgi:hypothetical protein
MKTTSRRILFSEHPPVVARTEEAAAFSHGSFPDVFEEYGNKNSIDEDEENKRKHLLKQEPTTISKNTKNTLKTRLIREVSLEDGNHRVVSITSDYEEAEEENNKNENSCELLLSYASALSPPNVALFNSSETSIRSYTEQDLDKSEEEDCQTNEKHTFSPLASSSSLFSTTRPPRPYYKTNYKKYSSSHYDDGTPYDDGGASAAALVAARSPRQTNTVDYLAYSLADRRHQVLLGHQFLVDSPLVGDKLRETYCVSPARGGGQNKSSSSSTPTVITMKESTGGVLPPPSSPSIAQGREKFADGHPHGLRTTTSTTCSASTIRLPLLIWSDDEGDPEDEESSSPCQGEAQFHRLLPRTRSGGRGFRHVAELINFGDPGANSAGMDADIHKEKEEFDRKMIGIELQDVGGYELCHLSHKGRYLPDCGEDEAAPAASTPSQATLDRGCTASSINTCISITPPRGTMTDSSTRTSRIVGRTPGSVILEDKAYTPVSNIQRQFFPRTMVGGEGTLTNSGTCGSNLESQQRFRESQFQSWTSRLEEAKQFRNEHGHCRIPHKLPSNQGLAGWAKRQRYQYTLRYTTTKNLAGRRAVSELSTECMSTLTAERVTALDSIGFCWDARSSSWFDRFEELRAFVRQCGNANVPYTYHANKKLAVWVKSQRHQHKLWKRGLNATMTREREYLLNSIGFVWCRLPDGSGPSVVGQRRTRTTQRKTKVK